MARAIRIHEHGGPEVLRFEESDPGSPMPGWVRIRHRAVGLNYIDTYHRSGLYPLALPSGLGLEAAGVVEEVGQDVTRWKIGDRVAYGTGPLGAYAEVANVPADRAVAIPDAVSDEAAAALMLKGLTAWFLLRRTYRVKAGDTILFHAAAGGVGTLACQWANHLGATVIGTAGSEAKAKSAREHGCAHVIDYSTENFTRRVQEITKGEGVPVVYDGVGKATFDGSIDCLRPLGLMVSFGNASGPPPPVNLATLSQAGSLFITRPTLMHYTRDPGELAAGAAELFELVGKGVIKVEVNQRYPLSEAAAAHRDLEARKTTGATVLLP
ncbi:MAG TPA: quinone oxidoreductase [Candidatus Limnocylindrales bacterium]|jgi:NADPH2:quinone reductase|nr:quinone oxidoreductase [Candidatus Limnocylindrales bacterium]